MGTVANKANQFRRERGFRGEMLCFGDPRTRVLRRVIDVQGERIDERTMRCHLPRRREQTDIRIQLPVDSWSKPSFALLKQQHDVNNGILGLDAFFTTLAPRLKSECLMFEIINQSELGVVQGALKQLLLDVRYFDRLILSAMAAFTHDESATLARLAEAVMAFREILQGWPLARLNMGSAIAERVVTTWKNYCQKSLDQLIKSLLLWYAGLPEKLFAMNVVRGHYQMVGEVTTSTACHYCGSPVDEFTWSSLFELDERRLGSCQACGPVYDGDPSIGAWLKTSNQLILGHTDRVKIEVKNPYDIPISARSVVLLSRFDRKPELPFYSRRVILRAKSAGALQMRISTPAEYVPGVYYLKAAAVVGARVNYLRCPIVIVRPNKNEQGPGISNARSSGRRRAA